jgi:hypothetical protein
MRGSGSRFPNEVFQKLHRGMKPDSKRANHIPITIVKRLLHIKYFKKLRRIGQKITGYQKLRGIPGSVKKLRGIGGINPGSVLLSDTRILLLYS